MDVACPKCASQVTLSPADMAAPERLGAVLCKACGHQFDARPTIIRHPDRKSGVTGGPPQPPHDPPAAKKAKEKAAAPAAAPKTDRSASDTLEPMSPEDATAELQKHKPKAIEGRSVRHLPKRIDTYNVLDEINRGGMGVVYKAVDPKLRRLVAIKVLLAGEGAKDEDLKRFQREAQATARLQHPSIVPIYAVGEYEGKPYLVMDYVEGHTAKQLKEEGKMTPRLALSIIECVAEGLHHAHLHGVIHRDVKPANIMVDKAERAQLMDFGLARRVDEDLEVTQSGTTMGTPSYMAPEQAEGRLAEVDAQSDVYSAGACLYELLTGRPPFEAPTVMATLKQVLEETPVPPRRLNPKIHRDVETICLKCLEKNKRNRYSSAKQLAEDIRRFNAGEAISAKPLGPVASAFRKARRHKEVTLAVLVVALSAFGMLGYSINQTRQVARQQAADRARSLRTALDDGVRLLTQARDTMAHLNEAGRGDFQQNAGRARAQIADANAAFRQVEGISPGDAEAKRALETLKKMDNELEVRRFIFKARAFLFPAQDRQGEPSAPPNHAAAQFAAQEALDRDPANKEAQELLHLAVGIRAVTIETNGGQADVYARRVMDGAGRQLPGGDGAGQALGRAPVTGKELEPGLYIVTLKRGGMAPQEATLAVTRDSREEDLRLRVTLDAPEENMVVVRAGNVTLPQVGAKSVPAFAMDRYEYPNRAGTVPVTGLTLVEARNKCKERGKQLCNSAQWLRACMGDEEWRYPYGKTYVNQACATGFDGTAQKTPLPSGLFARCRTPEGVYDMSGNVAEWTEPERAEQQETVFGGDWTSPTRFADLTVSCIARSLPEEVNKDRLGFRCCKSR